MWGIAAAIGYLAIIGLALFTLKRVFKVVHPKHIEDKGMALCAMASGIGGLLMVLTAVVTN